MSAQESPNQAPITVGRRWLRDSMQFTSKNDKSRAHPVSCCGVLCALLGSETLLPGASLVGSGVSTAAKRVPNEARVDNNLRNAYFEPTNIILDLQRYSVGRCDER